jgi:hypothetical protein
MNMSKLHIIYFIASMLTIASCTNEEDELTPESVSRTLIVYMAADNDLSADALADLEEMKQGFSENGTNLIVFIDLMDENPRLLKIHPRKETVIKSYPEMNSANPEVLKQVIEEIIKLYPTPEYGLILWSHGTSWLPAGSTLRSFGQDSGKQMNIIDLAKALPIRFGFILMDACLMGSVEVAYELKDKTDFIIASSTETIYTGFPYDKIIPELLKPEWDLKAVGQCYFDYYNSLQGAYQSATLSLIDTKELDDLAALTRKLISEQSFNLASFDRTSVQRLDVYNEQYTFDFFDFIDKAFPEADKTELIRQLGKAIPYKANTIMFLGEYALNTYCGLSSYIPHNKRNDLNNYYKQLSWYKAGGYDRIF